MKEGLLEELKATEAFFYRSTSCLTEEDSTYAPQQAMFTVAQHVAHTAQTIEWFIQAMTRPEGFDLDFEKHLRDVKECQSLTKARTQCAAAFAKALTAVAQMTEKELLSPFPEGPVMGGDPRCAAIGGLVDHTAHHRGALSVYSRLIGKTPPMPYMDV